jgi:hypothetical protein
MMMAYLMASDTLWAVFKDIRESLTTGMSNNGEGMMSYSHCERVPW